MMIKTLLKSIWRYFDVICIVSATVFAVCGFFMLNFIAGIFSVAGALLILALLSELIAGSINRKG